MKYTVRHFARESRTFELKAKNVEDLLLQMFDLIESLPGFLIYETEQLEFVVDKYSAVPKVITKRKTKSPTEDIQTSVKKLADQFDATQVSFGIGSQKIVAYAFVKKALKSIPETWEGFPVEKRYVGKVKPA